MQRRLPLDDLLKATHLEIGLDQARVSEQRLRYGSNEIIPAVSSSWLGLLRDTLRDPMVWFLVVTALVFAAVGDYVEAVVLALALLPILGMDAFLHRRTQVSTKALAQQISSKAVVTRDGCQQEIHAVDLVPGDIVKVRANDFVPADAVFVDGTGLQVDESALTGEAMPVRKSVATRLEAGMPLESEHWANAGTRLLTGEARLVVVYTGQATHYGEIVRLAQASSQERTPLQQSMMSLTKTLLLVALAFCVVLGVTRVLQGHGWLDALISSVTLAIAALPEEFPVVFAAFLGVGVYRLAQNQALVRRAVVVENIGRVTCICSDKTGTLTEGRLILAHQLPADDVTSEALLRAGAMASRRESADPLDLALLQDVELSGVKVLSTFPFTEDRRRETAVVELEGQQIFAYTKGAPETILGMCELDEAQTQAWLDKALELAGTGHKVIGFGERWMAAVEEGEEGERLSSQAEPSEGYRFLGLMAFEDPIRAGAIEAVHAAQVAGIRVIMVTGDHAATALAIARELGIGGQGRNTGSGDPVVISGDAIGQCHLTEIDVVARATPAQKLKLVQRLREAGEIVAVTGDGVNDAPALKGADIGIAMGERGTQAAREVASIVLLDDNFRTIVRAIAEGRQLFANLQLSFAYLLMIHIPLVVTAAWIPFAGYPLLYQPIHIVWLELIIHPTAFLAFQQGAGAHSLEQVGASRRAASFFDWRQWSLIISVGFVVTVVMITAFEYSLGGNHDVEHARTLALAVLIFCGVAVSLCLGAWQTRAAIAIAVSVAVVSVVIMQVTTVAAWFDLKPLHGSDWLLVLGVACVTGWLASWFKRLGIY